MNKPRPKMKASCDTFYCDHMRERVCCRRCPRLKKCKNHCLNHPSKCGSYIGTSSGGPK